MAGILQLTTTTYNVGGIPPDNNNVYNLVGNQFKAFLEFGKKGGGATHVL